MGARTDPFPGNLYAHTPALDPDAAYDPDQPLPTIVADIDKANLMTSMWTREASGLHRPVIDIDMPVHVVPSTNPLHSHVYIDHAMTWGKYRKLLHALADAEIVERGYVNASEERGYTAVRMPWVRKPTRKEE